MKFRVGSILQVYYSKDDYAFITIIESTGELVRFTYLTGVGKGQSFYEYKRWLIENARVFIK